MKGKILFFMLAAFALIAAAVWFEGGEVNAVAPFTDEETPKEQYQVRLDGYEGDIIYDDESTRKQSVVLTVDKDKIQSLDLSKYSAKREGCTFCGWGSNDWTVKDMLDESDFKKAENITLFALYKKTTFEDTSYVLKLDANGGTIDEKFVNSYDFLSEYSDAAMPIFHYIPLRDGYKFKGWNSKKDGSGQFYTVIDRGSWRLNGGDLERESPMDDGISYKYITLYAVWEKVAEKSVVVPSTGDIQGSVELELPEDGEYSLNLTRAPITDALAGENVRYLLDINLFNKTQIVSVNGRETKVKIALPDEWKGYDSYEVVYVSESEGKIAERFACTVEEGFINFVTTYLGQYGIVAKKNESGTSGGSPMEDPNKGNENGGNAGNPNTTGDTNTGNTNTENTNPPVNPPATPNDVPSSTDNSNSAAKNQTPKKKKNKYERRLGTPKLLRKTKREWVTLTWKKMEDVDGYEVEYSTSKKFIGKKTTRVRATRNSKKLIRKEKNKNYYARVRAYKIVKKKRVYTDWSVRAHIGMRTK